MYTNGDSPLSSPGEKACLHLVFRKRKSNNTKGIFDYKIRYIEKVFSFRNNGTINMGL